MRRYERLDTPPQWGSKVDRLAELARVGIGTSRESDLGSVLEEEPNHQSRTTDLWRRDSPLVREYVFLAETDGFRPTSIEQGRQILIRYERFLTGQVGTDLKRAGWKEYAAYRAHLAQREISRSTIRCYLRYLTSYYRLRAQASQALELLDDYMRVRAIGVGRPGKGQKWRPLDTGVVRRLLKAAEGEDYLFLMTLLSVALNLIGSSTRLS